MEIDSKTLLKLVEERIREDKYFLLDVLKTVVDYASNKILLEING